jgi:hypothetical protein
MTCRIDISSAEDDADLESFSSSETEWEAETLVMMEKDIAGLGSVSFRVQFLSIALRQAALTRPEAVFSVACRFRVAEVLEEESMEF